MFYNNRNNNFNKDYKKTEIHNNFQEDQTFKPKKEIENNDIKYKKQMKEYDRKHEEEIEQIVQNSKKNQNKLTKNITLK